MDYVDSPVFVCSLCSTVNYLTDTTYHQQGTLVMAVNMVMRSGKGHVVQCDACGSWLYHPNNRNQTIVVFNGEITVQDNREEK